VKIVCGVGVLIWWARQKEATMFTDRSALSNGSTTLESSFLHLQSKKKTDSFFETLWRILPKTMVSVQTQVKSFFIDHLHITLCVLYWIARGLNSPSITSHPLGRSYASSLRFPSLYFFLIGLNVFRFDFQSACLICPFWASSSLLDLIAPESLVIC